MGAAGKRGKISARSKGLFGKRKKRNAETFGGKGASNGRRESKRKGKTYRGKQAACFGMK